MKQLLTFGGFAHDPQGILTAVHGLALVSIKPSLDRILSTAALPRGCGSAANCALQRSTDAEQEDAFGFLYDPEFALLHRLESSASGGTDSSPVEINCTTTLSAGCPTHRVLCDEWASPTITPPGAHL